MRYVNRILPVAASGNRWLTVPKCIVMEAMITAFEFEYLVSTGISSRHTDGVHGGFRAGVGESHQVNTGKFLDPLGCFNFVFIGHGIGITNFHRFFDFFTN